MRFIITLNLICFFSLTTSCQKGNSDTEQNGELKYPTITDKQLLTKIQQQTFKYFWDFGHPTSGMARERNTSGEIVTSGGSGFGVMALIVGMEWGFITRSERTGSKPYSYKQGILCG